MSSGGGLVGHWLSPASTVVVCHCVWKEGEAGTHEASLSLSVPYVLASLSVVGHCVRWARASSSSLHEVGEGFHICVWGEWEGAWREGVGEGVVIVHPPRPHIIVGHRRRWARVLLLVVTRGGRGHPHPCLGRSGRGMEGRHR